MSTNSNRNAVNESGASAFKARTGRHGLGVLQSKAAERPLVLPARRFIFVRHGETAGNFQRILQHAGIELNETGIEQAHQVADLLGGSGAQRIVASTVQRAWQTAGIVSAALGIEALAEPLLRERSFGDLIGTSSRDLDWAADPPNGETVDQFLVRTQAGLTAALQDSRPTVVIAHGGTLYVLAYSLGLNLEEGMIRNATPLLFEPAGNGWAMQRIGSEVLPRGSNIGW
jgi:broad specificity phosphatase PhoE